MPRKYKLNFLTKIRRNMVYIYLISPGYFIATLIFTILMGFTSVISIWATKLLINGIVEVTINMEYNFLIVLLTYAGINILIQLINSSNAYISSKLQLRIDYKVSIDILNKCRDLSLQDFEDSEVYNLLNKAEIEGKMKVYSNYRNTLSIITTALSIASIAATILSWNSYIFLLIFITPIISTIVNSIIGYKHYTLRMKRMNEVRKTSYINYLLTNNIAYKEVKAYDIGSYLINIYSKIKSNIQEEELYVMGLRNRYLIILNLIEEIISLFVIFKVVLMATVGKILVGDTVAYIQSLSTIQSNVAGFLNNLSEIYNDILYIEEFYKFLDWDVKDNIDRTIEVKEIKTIEFKNVNYRYKTSNEYTLENVNIKLSKKELIGIIGENGSGKTTFIKLLCGFYDNYEGEILINGIDLAKINPNNLRKRIGIIFQDFNKYEFTLRENIGFGDIGEMNNDVRIIKVLNEINLKEKIDKFENSIDTQMGNWFQGEELSKGQWQRIALGRTFIRDADIYILDEPTSSLDPISEQCIFSLVRKKGYEKTAIIITHRIENIIELNPRVIVFSEGKIVGDGCNEVLVKNCKEYIKLLDKEKKH